MLPRWLMVGLGGSVWVQRGIGLEKNAFQRSVFYLAFKSGIPLLQNFSPCTKTKENMHIFYKSN